MKQKTETDKSPSQYDIETTPHKPLKDVQDDESIIYLELEDDKHENDEDLVVKNILKSHIITGISVSLIPVPFFDFAALTATQISLLNSLCKHYDITFDETNSKALLINLVGGSLPVLSMAGLSSLSKIVPGVGSLVGSASLSLVAGAATYAVGQVFNTHFLAGGTLEDFNPKQAQTLFKRELKKGKQMVAKLKQKKKRLSI
jgi:uncharacterized protein (DUF697 family)